MSTRTRAVTPPASAPIPAGPQAIRTSKPDWVDHSGTRIAHRNRFSAQKEANGFSLYRGTSTYPAPR